MPLTPSQYQIASPDDRCIYLPPKTVRDCHIVQSSLGPSNNLAICSSCLASILAIAFSFLVFGQLGFRPPRFGAELVIVIRSLFAAGG